MIGLVPRQALILHAVRVKYRKGTYSVTIVTSVPWDIGTSTAFLAVLWAARLGCFLRRNLRCSGRAADYIDRCPSYFGGQWRLHCYWLARHIKTHMYGIFKTCCVCWDIAWRPCCTVKLVVRLYMSRHISLSRPIEINKAIHRFSPQGVTKRNLSLFEVTFFSQQRLTQRDRPYAYGSFCFKINLCLSALNVLEKCTNK